MRPGDRTTAFARGAKAEATKDPGIQGWDSNYRPIRDVCTGIKEPGLSQHHIVTPNGLQTILVKLTFAWPSDYLDLSFSVVRRWAS